MCVVDLFVQSVVLGVYKWLRSDATISQCGGIDHTILILYICNMNCVYASLTTKLLRMFVQRIYLVAQYN